MIEVAYQRFFLALYHALTSTDSLQARTEAAWEQLRGLEVDHLPDEQLRARFSQFLAEGESGRFAMPQDQAADYLRQALSLFGGIAIAYGERGDPQEVPALPRRKSDIEAIIAGSDESVSEA
jgi:hypothetical protein